MRGEHKVDGEAEVFGAGLFPAKEIKVGEREGGRGRGDKEPPLSHLPAKPAWWQPGPCHFGSMNIHY